MMIVAYRVLWLLVWPVLPVFWLGRVWCKKEAWQRLPERLGLGRAPKTWRKKLLCPPKIVHVHGASVGECKSLEPLIKTLLAGNPNLRVVLTSGTRTSAKVVARMLQQNRWQKRVQHRLLPWDLWPCVALFYRQWQPEVSVFAESELWPELLHQAAKRCPHKPLLINARLSEKSFMCYQKHPRLARALYGCFGAIFARSPRDETRLKTLGFVPQSTGDIKYDALPLPFDANKVQHYATLLKGRSVCVAASTHAGEEALMTQAATMLPNAFTVVAPRHPERGSGLCAEHAWPQRSAGTELTQQLAAEQAVYVADTLGELGVWFALAAATKGVVMMGGSFSPAVQGHNPLEPVVLGAKTLCGPHMANFADMVHGLGKALHHTSAETPQALAQALQQAFSAPAPGATNLPHGATAEVARHVKSLLG